MPSPEGTHRRMLDELIRSNAVDKRWAEELIAGAATLEDLERAAIGTADNRWRIPRFNGRACVNARHMRVSRAGPKGLQSGEGADGDGVLPVSASRAFPMEPVAGACPTACAPGTWTFAWTLPPSWGPLIYLSRRTAREGMIRR